MSEVFYVTGNKHVFSKTPYNPRDRAGYTFFVVVVIRTKQ